MNGKEAVVEMNRTLLPDSNSVHFNGKIYVLQDKYTYFAASALSSVARQKENIILIGEPSALLSGYTFPAIMFKLPNSGIPFYLGFSTDLSGGEDNPYMDQPEVEILESLDEYLDKVINNDGFGEDYLINKDKLIKFVKQN